MTPEVFWVLIQFAGARCRENGTNIEEELERELERELVRLPADEIVSFDGHLQACLRVATECVIPRTKAHVCEGFHHLLVARGREVFLAAVADPEAAVAGYGERTGLRTFSTSPPRGLSSRRRSGTSAGGKSAGAAAITPASFTRRSGRT